MKRFLLAAIAAIIISAVVLSSCVSAPGGKSSVVLPLSAGWYMCDSARTFKDIETEFSISQNTGMKAVSEVTYNYTGVVCRFDSGALYDPVTGIELLIDREGRISCAENVSIKGSVSKNGGFYWSGVHEENGRLHNIFVKGSLTPLPASVRGGREFNGVYHLIDTGTNKEQLVNISDGFYTWKFIEEEDDEDGGSFTPWPTLINPDGSFSFTFEITTVMEMMGMTQNFSTGFSAEGKVVPGQGISMSEVTRTAGMGNDYTGEPQIYSGTAIRSGEYPNEAIPANIESLISSGRAAVKTAPKPNRAKYPSWYLNPPEKAGFIYAAGEKTFNDKDTALAMAEAAAAAGLADQIRVRIESSITEVSNNAGTTIDDRMRSETLQQLDYRVIEQTYSDGTAFVLLEMKQK